MSDKLVGELTVEELKALIAEVVDRRLRYWQQPERVVDKEELQKIFDKMDRLRWTPPPGSPTTLEMLREDRDR